MDSNVPGITFSEPLDDTSVRAVCERYGIDYDQVADQQDTLDMETGKRVSND